MRMDADQNLLALKMICNSHLVIVRTARELNITSGESQRFVQRTVGKCCMQKKKQIAEVVVREHFSMNQAHSLINVTRVQMDFIKKLTIEI